MLNGFSIEVEEEAPPAEPGGPPRPPGIFTAGVPPITPVFQSEWGKYKFHEDSALLIKQGEEADSYDVFVNMDNIHLKNEIAKRKNLDGKVIGHWFKFGLYLLGLGMLQQQKANAARNTRDGEEATFDIKSALDLIATASQGMAMTIIPVVAQLGRMGADD